MKFSLLLPTKNRLTYLRYAVESVRRQDHQDWEIVISDNCSEEDIAGWVAGLADPRIVYVRTQHPLCVTDNWNNAIARASGDWVLMLGDDDGLTPGHLARMAELIAAHGDPDLIFTNAWIYAYPGVIPGSPSGFLKRDASPIFAAAQPYILPPAEARRLVDEALRFRMAYPFNMQYSVVSRRLLEALRRKGEPYQSPYPDYYATNALFLLARRILVEPTPRVIIGVSPKSYGFYHFNDKEDEGLAFLDNAPAQRDAERLAAVLLPGTRGASSWLLAMEKLCANFSELGLRADHRRYRHMQMGTAYKRYHLAGTATRAQHAAHRARLTWTERWLRGLPLALALRLMRLGGRGRQQRLLLGLRRLLGHAHAGSLGTADTGAEATGCTDLVAVYEHLAALRHATLPAEAGPHRERP